MSPNKATTSANEDSVDGGTSTSAKTLSSSEIHHVRSISDVSSFQQEADREARRAAVKNRSLHGEDEAENPFLVNACSAEAGARVLFATDEWFATADNLLQDSDPSFDETAYCEQGKVMDGWETRRRREAGHDWCLIKLARRTQLTSVVLDTAFFTGNNTPAISLEVADLSCADETRLVAGLPGVLGRLLYGGGVQGTGATPAEVEQAQQACQSVTWNELLPKTPLFPGYEECRHHHFQVVTDSASPSQIMIGTHIRLNYFPDGGVARMRLYGVPQTNPTPVTRPLYTPIVTGRTCTVVAHESDNCNELLPSQQLRRQSEFVELSCSDNGGMGVTCSNKHYGDPANLIQASYGRDMGDGWETARHPDRPSILIKDPVTNLVDSPLSDWCILKLGAPTQVQRIILDTKHFRGNYPESVSVEGCYFVTDETCSTNARTTSLPPHHVEWFTLVPRGRMAPDSEHLFFPHQIDNHHRTVTHVRVSICPDGGLSRVRVYGAALQ